MNGRLDWTELLFSWKGRMSRASFLIAATVLIFAAWLYEALAGPMARWITGWFVYPFLLFCGACVLSKRLHDRGRTGWWAALALVALVAVWSPPASYPDFLFSLVLIWAAVELGAMPGEQGANRFGPNPLRPVQA